MSQFIGAAQPVQRTEANDNSLRRLGLGRFFRFGFLGRGRGRGRGDFRTPFWPRSGLTGDQGLDTGLGYWPSWDTYYSTKGKNSRFGYQGVSRDVNNSPLAGCTIKLFRTATDEKVTPDITSEADGSFVISTPYYEPHWLRMSKSGAPDLQCTTVATAFPNT
jgi:hypothetical protein